MNANWEKGNGKDMKAKNYVTEGTYATEKYSETK